MSTLFVGLRIDSGVRPELLSVGSEHRLVERDVSGFGFASLTDCSRPFVSSRGRLFAGVGHRASLLAEAYPESTFVGIDYYELSMEAARERAEAAGVADRVSFEVATATSYNGAGYDFVTMFDLVFEARP